MTARLLVIAGPTAAGKSRLALAVCERVGGEIISADSVQVYRGLDVGSAKATPAEQARVPHHAIDLLAPTEQSHAGRWLAEAEAAIDAVRGRGRVPVVCGGTGLYLRALLEGLAAIPEVTPEVRAAVAEDLAARGVEALHAELATVDPAAAERLAPRDAQRISRALAVYRETGRPISAWQAAHGFTNRRPDARVVVVSPEPRELLLERIDARAAWMLAHGLVDEVRGLLAEGVPPDAPGLLTLGYREVVDELLGRGGAGPLAERVARGHRRYAKRQLTWFRRLLQRDTAALRLDPRDPDVVERLLALLA